jgi:hypothetical protein
VAPESVARVVPRQLLHLALGLYRTADRARSPPLEEWLSTPWVRVRSLSSSRPEGSLDRVRKVAEPDAVLEGEQLEARPPQGQRSPRWGASSEVGSWQEWELEALIAPSARIERRASSNRRETVQETSASPYDGRWQTFAAP